MGMVVRTNTMALNAYRQLGMNNSAVAKSLEKLASGYRINRAGDDAAGLAISEKMKAQITGLETASANAQDGISLIQTAEGNLNEVHDMLNRMVELASKSANGTYTSTERQALQDEMDQLLSEIDRISQSANFNGTKLLDGSMSGGVKVANQKDATLTILTDGQLSKTPQAGIYSIDFTDASITNTKTAAGGGTAAVAAVYDSGTVTALTGDGDLTIGGITVAITDTAGANNTLTAQLNAWVAGATSADWTVAVNDAGDGIKFTAKTAGAIGGDGPATAPAGATQVTEGKDAVAGGAAAGTVNDGVTFSIFGQTLTLDDIAADATVEGKELAQMIADAWNTGNNGGKYQLDGVDVTASVEGNKLVFKMDDAPTTHTDTTAATGVFGGTDFMQNNGHQLLVTVEQEPAGKVGRLYGKATMTLGAADVADGTTLKIGDTTYVFAVGANSKYKDADNAIDLTDRNVGDGDLIKEAAKRLSTAAADNKNFKVGTTTVDGQLTFTEREGGVDYSKNNLAGSDHTGTNVPGANNTTAAADVTATANDWKGLIQTGMVDTSSGSKALTLQIGDMADSFNKLSVSVADMSATGLGLDGLKKTGIMTEASASNAIDTIKTAINTVSSTRAGLGALQNRLEHTINNLDVAAENLSAANSRIRDTDMAKEMMNYTKMNVLVQSAQAMLAQANQQPQSVLQLLQ